MLLYITGPAVRALQPTDPFHPTAARMRDNRRDGRPTGQPVAPRRAGSGLVVVAAK
ncbi:MAG: hypothetical protein KJ698_08305 [Actinobacteria bacterium]|jgi:hypothetical protein|nr:hypothetical protein [Actinomycetota bacterium]MBU1493525.1 hypothetical protein [Actinomycetota bacterium]MBU1866624.1 hypothetical protein [Actinomycetota bacterium]